MRATVATDEDIPAEGTKCVEINGRTYALFKVSGKVYCLDNQCTHMGGPLCKGTLREFVVQCPWHGSRFDVRTGQVGDPLAPRSECIRPPLRAGRSGRIFRRLLRMVVPGASTIQSAQTTWATAILIWFT
jgi:nitrite reductase/ring-hydroxylating ferredoxin subunit